MRWPVELVVVLVSLAMAVGEMPAHARGPFRPSRPPPIEHAPVYRPPPIEHAPVYRPPPIEHAPVYRPPPIEREPVFRPPPIERPFVEPDPLDPAKPRQPRPPNGPRAPFLVPPRLPTPGARRVLPLHLPSNPGGSIAARDSVTDRVRVAMPTAKRIDSSLRNGDSAGLTTALGEAHAKLGADRQQSYLVAHLAGKLAARSGSFETVELDDTQVVVRGEPATAGSAFGRVRVPENARATLFDEKVVDGTNLGLVFFPGVNGESEFCGWTAIRRPPRPASSELAIVEAQRIESGRSGAIVEHLDGVAAKADSKRVIFWHGGPLRPFERRAMEDNAVAVFDEIESLDSDTVIVHSDDAKKISVLRKVGDKTVAYVTRDRASVMAVLDSLPASMTLVMSGRVPALNLTTRRMVMRRLFNAVVPLKDAVEHARSERTVTPRAVVNGVPRTATELAVQRLPPSGARAYRNLASFVDGQAASRGHQVISSKDAFLDLLRRGDDDFAIIVAHSDGKRIYIGDQEISLEELASMESRSTPAHRTIIMAVCNAGRSAMRLSQLKGFAQLFVEKGFATSIIAPNDTIGHAEVEALFTSMGANLDSFLRGLRDAKGTWELLVQLEFAGPPSGQRRSAS
jgi:hypothetical protein